MPADVYEKFARILRPARVLILFIYCVYFFLRRLLIDNSRKFIYTRIPYVLPPRPPLPPTMSTDNECLLSANTFYENMLKPKS